MIIAIEGLPGAGKTTTADEVARRLGARSLCESTLSHPFLQSVYDDAERRDDLLVELAFLVLHAAAFRGLSSTEVTVTDYSPVKDELFALDMLKGKDHRTFQRTYAALYAEPRPDIVVYLRASATLCLKRVRRRLQRDERRTFEESMTIERLERMRLLYEAHLHRLGRKVLCLEVDASMDVATVTNLTVALLPPGLIADARDAT